ncbi:glycosyl transferase [Paenibacillus albicereus]|uniref:Glycosyl transferase n=1 Tax=Paenibacillus albicereus TaxID=2726185 RepID=A0A6H2GWP1_9BACL|nr:flagellar brake domain-containing protein [Paenibacillus albicereus]QJC51843.1 glycosyl transferase [Paenibacillus albicereus]
MLPKINDFLFIQVASSDEEEAQSVFKSRVADEDADSLYMEIPIHEPSGKLRKLYLGDELSIYIISPDGVKHYFNSYVTGYRDDVLRLIRIRKAEESSMTRIQRRSFLRVPAELELAVSVRGQHRFIGITDDVGGGGISFHCEASRLLENGMELECWLLVPFKNGVVEHAFFKSEIIRVKVLENGRKQAMVKFTTISEPDRQKIIRCCFERQLELRK